MSFLEELRKANMSRATEWFNGKWPDPIFNAVELGGETGELLNMEKKLYRERNGWRGSRVDKEELEREVADVMICLDLYASRYDIDIEEVTRRKFNATSEKQDFPHRL